MSTYSSHEQRLLDQQSGAAMDRRTQKRQPFNAYTTAEAVGRTVVLTIHVGTEGAAERTIALLAEDVADGRGTRILLPDVRIVRSDDDAD